MTASATHRNGETGAHGPAFPAYVVPPRGRGRDRPGAAQVAAVRQQIERQFLKVGGNLETLSMGLAALHEPLETLSEMQGAAWETVGTQLAGLDGEFDALEAAFSEYAQLIGAIVETAGALSPDVARVTRTVRTMKIVALNARVAASTIATMDAGLEVFTSTAGSLIETADSTTRAVGDQIARILETTRKTFDATYARAWRELAQARGAIATVRSFVAGAVAPTAGRQDFGQALQDRLQQLHTRLADAAMAMQAGDRARQRLEHVEALRSGQFGIDPVWGEVLAVNLLQGTVDEFDRDASDMERNMGDILALSHALAGGLGHGPGAGDATETDKTLSAVQAMRGSLSALHGVRTVFSDLVTSLSEDFESFAQALRRIGEIEAQMHIVGVNAVITCSRLGDEGAALKEVANQLASLSAEVALHFGGVRDRIGVVDRHFRKLSGDLAQRPRALIDAMELSSADLLERLRDVFAKWDRLQREMGLVQAQLETRIPGDLLAIKGLSKSLKSAASQGEAVSPPPHGQPDQDALARIYAQYSMDSERDIHRACLARYGVSSAPTADPGGSRPVDAAQDLDDIFF